MTSLSILFTNDINKKFTCFCSISEYIHFLLRNDVKVKSIKSEIDSITSEMAFDVYNFIMCYKNTKELCNNFLNEYNEKLIYDSEEEFKEMISEFVRMNGNGKCLRAFLVALGYQSLGNNDNNYLKLASALEIFQTAILIHDDIIDNATLRRGIDTIPISYGKAYENPINVNDTFLDKKKNFANSMGICIGDLGFYLANGLIIDAYNDNPNFGRLFKYYNDVVIKTCKGEMIDVKLPFTEEFFVTDKKLEEKIMEIYRLKTAWYSVIGPYCLGMILGNASALEIKQMEEILMSVGVAFQIKDDLLGIYGDEKKIGKSSNSDISEYKQTLLYAFAMNTEYKDELLKYYGKNLNDSEYRKVKDIFDKSGAKKYAEDKMNELFDSSEKQIDSVTFLSDLNKSILKGFIIYLKNRSK